MKDICILATGGTIDKTHDVITEELVFSERSHLPEMLADFRIPNLHFQVLMLKDSLDITDEDRTLMAQVLQIRPERSIVLTHGTSTMVETAQFLAKTIKDKTVVLTGAMRPFSLFKSDAGFNLGCAIAAAQVQPNGIYLAMNGQVFTPDTVTKDLERGVFVKI